MNKSHIRHLLTLRDWTPDELVNVLTLALRMKKRPWWYRRAMKNKTLLMLFAKPSLRTRLSFETAMLELGGHAIFYDMATSPLGKKESIKDGAMVSELYVDAVMARLYEHKTIQEFAHYSNKPVINGLTNKYHPCQALGDFLTMHEMFGSFDIKVAYLGDGNNNVTHSLMLGCAKLGIKMDIACPAKKGFMPDSRIMKETGVRVTSVKKAVKGADIVYTDSWQSYHISDSEMDRRTRALKPFQVTRKVMPNDAYFMHCLPAKRGAEVTADVIDGNHSIILRQAENRKHVEKAILRVLVK
jgi:ornithine carbamoyltransferase